MHWKTKGAILALACIAANAHSAIVVKKLETGGWVNYPSGVTINSATATITGTEVAD